MPSLYNERPKQGNTRRLPAWGWISEFGRISSAGALETALSVPIFLLRPKAGKKYFYYYRLRGCQ
jgi:hypothetical protein